MRIIQILSGFIGLVALAVGLILLVNADRNVGGYFIVTGSIFIAGFVIASAISRRE